MNRQAIDNTKYATWLTGNGPRTEVTATYYDHAAFTLGGVTQHHLRNRVASITTEAVYDGDAGTYHHATHYSYDIHGNVKSLWQESPPMEQLDQNPGQGLKRIDYTYDLISGKVNKVSYQPGQPDSWYHRYLYDADNRLVQAETGPDDVMYDIDARYFYYPHGPLARVEYGDHLVQGVDYAYTLQGWLKGVNSNLLTAENDIGQDGIVPIDTNTYPHRWAGRDAVGFTLGYRAYDYTPIDSAHSQPGIWGDAVRFEAGRYFENDNASPSNLMQHRNNLYNGNIGSMVTTVPVQQSITDTTTIFNVAANGYSYRYDQLNRLREAIAVDNLQANPANAGYNTWKDESTPATLYTNKFEYDANGNILRQLRADATDTPFDSLTYKYHETGGKRLSNRLYHVNDQIASNVMADDIDDQGPFDDNPANLNINNNYSYDETGNLIKDAQEQIASIKWTVTGKVSKIIREANSGLPDLEFRYDAMGNRIMKIVKPDGTSSENGGTDDPTEWSITHYVRDATGNPMAVYDEKYLSQQLELTLKERYLYGSSRLGMNTDTVDMIVTHNPNFQQRHLGKKMYELNNHLGNVLAVVTDKKIPIQDGTTGNKSHYVADVVSVTDYYPFGAVMGERTWSGEGYRFGFNSQEKDDEIKGEGNSINYLARIQDPRLGKFLSIDPLIKSFPMLTPYQFASNTPIQAVDLDGKEALHFQYQIRSLITGEIAGVTGSASIGMIVDKNFNAIMTATVSGGIAGGVAPIIGGTSATYYHTASSYKDVLGHGFNAGIFLSKNPAGVKPIAGYEVNLSFREEDGSSIVGGSRTFELFSFGKGGGAYAEYAHTFTISEPFNLLDGTKTIMEKTGLNSEAASDLIKNLQNQLEQSIKNHQSENFSIPQMLEKGWTVPAEAIDTHNKLQEIGNRIGNSVKDMKKDEKK